MLVTWQQNWDTHLSEGQKDAKQDSQYKGWLIFALEKSGGNCSTKPFLNDLEKINRPELNKRLNTYLRRNMKCKN